MAGAILVAATVLPTSGRAASNDDIKKAYTKARTLYSQGNYADALKAFDRVRDLRFHPILLYGMASCYEGLGQLKQAVEYLQRYLKHYPKNKMSPKHPKPDDVKAKIAGLNKRMTAVVPPNAGTSATGTSTGAAAGTGTGTAPATGTGTGTPTAPATGTRAVGATGAHAVPTHAPSADPVPGGYIIPPPPGYGVYRQSGPARRSLVFSLDLGAASFAAAGADSPTRYASTGGGLFVTALWRIFPYFAVGAHGGASFVGGRDGVDAGGVFRESTETFIFAAGMIDFRGYLPVSRLDFWLGLGIGYASQSQRYTVVDGAGFEVDATDRYKGPAVSASIGADFFLSSTLSLGILARVYKMFPKERCGVDTTFVEVCTAIPSTENPGILWYAGIAATYHLPMNLGIGVRSR